jgi:hypothetical protein
MQNDLDSRDQSWNPLEEKTTQDRCEHEVPLPTLFAFCQLALHVS